MIIIKEKNGKIIYVLLIVFVVVSILIDGYFVRTIEKTNNDVREMKKYVENVTKQVNKNTTELSGDYEWLSEIDNNVRKTNEEMKSIDERVKKIENN